jgi:hypothetical protein
MIEGLDRTREQFIFRTLNKSRNTNSSKKRRNSNSSKNEEIIIPRKKRRNYFISYGTQPSVTPHNYSDDCVN